MFIPWISDDGCKIVAIVGICKNAGKTTVLNSVLRNYPGKWGVLTTGRDGEIEDVLFKTPKPRVVIPPGNLFCCDAQSLDAHGAKVCVLAKTQWQSGTKPLWLVKAEQELETEIAGPTNAAAQMACAQQLLALGAHKVLIDGSLDRKSIVLSAGLDAIILVVGASFGSLEDIVAEVSRLLRLAEIDGFRVDAEAGFDSLAEQNNASKGGLLPQCIAVIPKGQNQGLWQQTALHSLVGNDKQLQELLDAKPKAIYIPGAFSSTTLHRIGKRLQEIRIVFRHAECIKLDHNELTAFLESHEVQCVVPFLVKAIAVNSTGIGVADLDAAQLLNKLKERFPNQTFFDLLELEQ